MRGRQLSSLPGARDILLLAASFAASVRALQQPFQPIETARALAKRQTGCIPNFYSCADQGTIFSDICCQNGQACRLDANNNPACCPSDAICTGVVPGTFAPTPTVSFVQNPYFSFPFVATSFAGPGACYQAINQCSDNYGACTAQLEGQAGFQVTIVVPDGGAGRTVVGGVGATYPTASATSICSSLLSRACGSLQPSMCAATGTTAGGFIIGNTAGNLVARPVLAYVVAAVNIAALSLA